MARPTLALAAIALALAACGKGAPKSSLPEMAKLPGITAAPATVTGNDQRAALFLRKGCPNCHSISKVGIKSSTDAGPDLSFAYEDVKNRFGVPLEQFLPNPTGTMQMVLGSLIKLTPEERDSVIHIIKELNEEQHEKDHH